MGTSEQMDLGSPTIKRYGTLFSKGEAEKVVEVADGWKSKGQVRNNHLTQYNTHQRIFIPANNVERKPEDGCMKKIKIERSLKLRNEDFKGRSKYDIVSGLEQGDSNWIDSFGKQAVDAGIKSPKTKAISDVALRSHWAEKLSIPVTS